MYKDTRRAIVKEVQNYLSSKGYNNSVGKYDKVVYGVRSLLEKTLLQPGTEKFNNAVHQEADKLLKKYNLTKDSKAKDAKTKKYKVIYDRYNPQLGVSERTSIYEVANKAELNKKLKSLANPVYGSITIKEVIEMKDSKAKDSEFDRLTNYVNSLNSELGSDWLELKGKAVHPDYAKREVLSIKKSIPSKVSSNDLTKEEAKKLHESINQVLKNIEETKRKYTGYDSKTVDSKVDIKSVFKGADTMWLVAKKGIRNAIIGADTVQELEHILDNMTFTDYSDEIDAYLEIMNEVSKAATEKRNQAIKELSELRKLAFKKISMLDKENK